MGKHCQLIKIPHFGFFEPPNAHKNILNEKHKESRKYKSSKTDTEEVINGINLLH